MTDLRNKATSGVLWSGLERIGQTVVVFLVQIVLARILEPEQFGLLAMVSVVVVISSAIVEAGLGAAIIQRNDITNEDLSTVLYFNIGVALLMACVLWWFAPWVAEFYDQPILSDVLAVLGLGVVLGSIGSVHRAMLRKQLSFKNLFWVTTPASILSGGIGILLAMRGYGVWALVTQSLCQRGLEGVALWSRMRWLPQLTFSASSLRRLLPYGSRLALSAILYNIFANIYVLVIGKIFTPLDVGFFQRARSIQMLPNTTLQTVVSGVTFPVLSSVQQDFPRMKRILRRSLQLSAILSVAGMAVMAALAEPLVVVLIGEKWLPCVPMLQILCIAGALYPIHAGNLSLLQATGRSDLYLKVELYKKILTIISIAVTYRIGIYPMICGMIATNIISLLINTHYTNKIIYYGIGDQLGDIWPAFVLGALVYGVAVMINVTVRSDPLINLVLGISGAAITILLTARFLPQDIKGELYLLSDRLPKCRSVAYMILK